MQYLIKLKDCDTGSEALIECSENMSLEELSIKIKVELQLPCFDNGIHCYLFHGKVFVPDDSNGDREFECILGEYPNDPLPLMPAILDHPKMPPGKAYRSSDHSHLKKVFTVKGSTLVYYQASPEGFHRVHCTLIDRFI